MNYVKSRARTQKLEELIQEYVRQNPDAVIEIQELLADTGLSMDALLANALSERREYLDHIERAGRARRRGCRIQSDRTSPAQRKRCCLTSERKVRANRENARASTGPKVAFLCARLGKNPPDLPMDVLVKFVTARKDRRNSQQSWRKRLRSYWRWTAMNGKHSRGETRPFEPSMRRADGPTPYDPTFAC